MSVLLRHDWQLYYAYIMYVEFIKIQPVKDCLVCKLIFKVGHNGVSMHRKHGGNLIMFEIAYTPENILGVVDLGLV